MFQRIFAAWLEAAKEFNGSPWFVRFATGGLQVEHYKGFLLETYHHAGLNPQIQAYTTMFFKDRPREMVDKFYRHAISEIGHDTMAANDLVNLGFDRELIVNSKPLPSTLALNAFVLYMVQFVNPIAYLGYLFHLEFLPTQNGHAYIDQLKDIGVPDNALTFLEEHATVDVGHNELMKKYVEYFVKDEKTLEQVIYTVQATARLHRLMLEGAFENGEKAFKNSATVRSISGT
jgi:pyrroloquinoline quinone (PQQ) biosynthesis protein C